jgi:DNA-binding MarR family transcriptional regulator
MNIEDSAAYLLARLSVSHRNLMEKTLKTIGLHSGQMFVLSELWKSDGQRQIDLAEKLNLSPPTVNKILGGLLENDFATRERYEDDARSTRIYLTQKGRDAKANVEAVWAVLEEETLFGLTDTERLLLIQLLRKLMGQDQG